MIAAIYARKSTEQAGVADDQKSVARQIEHARQYATRKGWTVVDDHVYVDDGISGAEFANRPGFLRLMNALKPRPKFQVLVMSEESRLGREAIETAYALKQLVAAGVRVFFYLEDRERTLDSPTDKIMLSLTTFADELEREKARQRTYDAMLRKARAGHVTGGRVFGYDNIEILGAGGVRSHVERRINDREAAVIRRIFELCAAGTGYTRIAKLLNDEAAPAPRAQQGRPSGWAPTSVKEVLERRLYAGEVIWNRTRKRDRWGQHHASARPESEWLRQHVPALQIVTEASWRAARERLDGIRAHLMKVSGGALGNRHHRDVESKYLLPGFARCTVCGGSLGVFSRSHGRKRAFFYGCRAYHKCGTTVCGNGLQLPIDRVDDAVLRTLGGDVLRPAVVMAIIDGVLKELEPQAARRNLGRARAELQTLERELENLATAIAAGGRLEPLLVQLQARQAKREDLQITVAAAELADVRRFDRKAIEQKVRAHVQSWRELLTKHVHDGRQLLREVLAGPLRFTPEGKTYRFEGEAAFGRLLAGMVGVAPFVASPSGTNTWWHAVFQDLSRRLSCSTTTTGSRPATAHQNLKPSHRVDRNASARRRHVDSGAALQSNTA
jgi:DNA invertase Pin-like site-specific DNA recombinase